MVPQSVITTWPWGLPEELPSLSTALTMSYKDVSHQLHEVLIHKTYHSLDNLAENDVLAVQPGGHNGGDEELGAVAIRCVSFMNFLRYTAAWHLRIGSSVGHALV